MNSEDVIDLSLKPKSSNTSNESTNCDNKSSALVTPTIVRPIPRPPWSIIWYQNLWPTYNSLNNSYVSTYSVKKSSQYKDETVALIEHSCGNEESTNNSTNDNNGEKKLVSTPSNEYTLSKVSTVDLEGNNSNNNSEARRESDPYCMFERLSTTDDKEDKIYHSEQTIQTEEDKGNRISAIIDIACCDGPVQFERISNPNFALTVQHQNEPSLQTTRSNRSASTSNSTSPTEINDFEAHRNISTKTYVCIYCNQSFKSLFCYQKHKKRHLNPVSVDITASTTTHPNTHPMVCAPENQIKAKDLNVQFFPCKKCGCKFPSYYFVHKHKKTCH